MEFKLLMGQSTFKAFKLQWQQRDSLNHGRVCSTIDTLVCMSMVAQCGLCLGGQPRVGSGRWVNDILPMFG